jgi:hypothetical protein
MSDFIPVELAAAMGLFMGCLARALLPFFKKKYQEADAGTSIRWENRYTWTLVFSTFMSFVAATFLLPTFEIPATNIFSLAFIMGWSSLDIVNGLAK